MGWLLFSLLSEHITKSTHAVWTGGGAGARVSNRVGMTIDSVSELFSEAKSNVCCRCSCSTCACCCCWTCACCCCCGGGCLFPKAFSKSTSKSAVTPESPAYFRTLKKNLKYYFSPTLSLLSISVLDINTNALSKVLARDRIEEFRDGGRRVEISGACCCCCLFSFFASNFGRIRGFWYGFSKMVILKCF